MLTTTKPSTDESELGLYSRATARFLCSHLQPLTPMKTRFFASLMMAAVMLGLPSLGHGQLLGGGSGLLGGAGSLLGGSRLGNSLGSLTSSALDPVSSLLNGVGNTVGSLTGTVGGVLNTTQSTLSTTVNSTSALRGVTSLLGGLDSFTRPSLDTSSLLSRFDTFGFPATNSVYSFGSDALGAAGGTGSSALSGATSGLSGSGSAFFFGWTPSGYVSTMSSPALRNFGPLGALLTPSATTKVSAGGSSKAH